MATFDRMRTSWFKPKTKPSREIQLEEIKAENAKRQVQEFTPTVDWDTAEAANEILENRAFTRVMERMRAARFAEIEGSAPGMAGMGVREQAHVGLKALEQIKSDLEAWRDELKMRREHADT